MLSQVTNLLRLRSSDSFHGFVHIVSLFYSEHKKRCILVCATATRSMVGMQSLFVAIKLVFVLVPLARNAISAIDSKGHSDVARKLSGTHINYASILAHPLCSSQHRLRYILLCFLCPCRSRTSLSRVYVRVFSIKGQCSCSPSVRSRSSDPAYAVVYQQVSSLRFR